MSLIVTNMLLFPIFWLQGMWIWSHSQDQAHPILNESHDLWTTTKEGPLQVCFPDLSTLVDQTIVSIREFSRTFFLWCRDIQPQRFVWGWVGYLERFWTGSSAFQTWEALIHSFCFVTLESSPLTQRSILTDIFLLWPNSCDFRRRLDSSVTTALKGQSSPTSEYDFYNRVCACSVAQSCTTLCDPTDHSLSHSSVRGIFRTGIMGGFPFSPPGGSIIT